MSDLSAFDFGVAIKRSLNVRIVKPLPNVLHHGSPKASLVHVRVRRRHLDFRHGTHCPGGGCQSSTLLPSGSMTQPNFPYSESSVFSRTLHPSSRSA